MEPVEAALCAASQFVKKPVQNQIHLSQGGGARGGGSPPRVGSNALNALPSKAFSERSEDFSAAQRWESIGIFRLSEKSSDFFDSLGGGAVRRLFSFFRKSTPALPKNSRKPARVIVNKS